MAKLRSGVLARGLTGTAGSVVFVQGPTGATYVRERPVQRQRTSEAQRAWRDLVRRAGQMWRSLDEDEVALWWAYTEAVRVAGPDFDAPPPNASGLFTGLAAKVWQIDPSAEPPRVPPATACTGDGISVAVEVVPGGVRFMASGPNAAGVVTELLLQSLPSRTARPQRGKDRSRGFVAFAPGMLSATVDARPGAYAASVRFVRAATGQMSGLVRLGTVVV